MTDKKRKYKSLIHDVPNKVEIQKKEHEMQNVLTVEELEEQLEEAIKGKARVDSKYVDYQSRGHLYDYKINYTEFLVATLDVKQFLDDSKLKAMFN